MEMKPCDDDSSEVSTFRSWCTCIDSCIGGGKDKSATGICLHVVVSGMESHIQQGWIINKGQK